jgi:hypothetical protein
LPHTRGYKRQKVVRVSLRRHSDIAGYQKKEVIWLLKTRNYVEKTRDRSMHEVVRDRRSGGGRLGNVSSIQQEKLATHGL